MSALFSRFVPGHFQNPLGVAMRVARSGGAEGRFALLSVPSGIIISPLDFLLQPFERGLYTSANAPQRPLILICGPARSGTSIVAATLIRSFPVGYVNNLMALFPRSPLVASRVLGVRPQNDKVKLKTYYGRTFGLRAQNDGLFLWDRWLGADRTNPHPELKKDEGRDMARFWAAFEQRFGKPIVTKNNNLITCASAVAKYLPTAHFLCLRREPIYLAQSLLIARQQIHGDASIPYGLREIADDHADPIRDVCRQVSFYENAAKQQLHSIGPERFWTVSYEEFCREPERLIKKVGTQVLGLDVKEDEIRRALPRIAMSNRRRIAMAEFARLAQCLDDQGVPVPEDLLAHEHLKAG